MKFLIELGTRTNPFTKLCGITLLDRVYRTLRHSSLAKIYVNAGVDKNVLKHMKDSGYEFETVSKKDDSFIVFSTDTVFNVEYVKTRCGQKTYRAPFIIEVASSKDLLMAESKLIEDCKKSGEGYITYLTRLVSLKISKYLCRTNITPNQITASRIPIFIVSSIFIACNFNYWTYCLGLIGHIMCATVLDAIDGDVARLKFQFSKQGEWMDMANDIIASILFTISIAIANSNLNSSTFDNVLNILTPILFITANLMMIHILFRNYSGGGFLSVMYDFSKNSRLKTILSEPVRRDTAMCIVCIIGMFYMTRAVLVMNCLMSIGIFVYYITVMLKPKPLVTK